MGIDLSSEGTHGTYSPPGSGTSPLAECGTKRNHVHDCNNIGIDFIGYEGSAPAAVDRARDGICRENLLHGIDSANNPDRVGSGTRRVGHAQAVHGGADDAAGVARAFAAGKESARLRVLQRVVPAGDPNRRAGARFKS